MGNAKPGGTIASFNARFRDEVLDAEIFGNLRESRVLIEAWRRFHDHERPRSALGHATPTEFAAAHGGEENNLVLSSRVVQLAGSRHGLPTQILAINDSGLQWIDAPLATFAAVGCDSLGTRGRRGRTG